MHGSLFEGGRDGEGGGRDGEGGGGGMDGEGEGGREVEKRRELGREGQRGNWEWD